MLAIEQNLIRAKLAALPPTMVLSPSEREHYKERALQLLRATDSALVAHYYTSGDIQDLAEASGGYVADSLEMARFGAQQSQGTLVVCGVRFMGETAKILSPEKRVLMPTLAAECSLDLACPIDEFSAFCDQHPERVVVVYANTSAEVKARADWVVTSSIALQVVDKLDADGEQIIWAPDKYLGSYVQQQTQADMLLWQGACIVHEEFKAEGLLTMKELYPQAGILAHPESAAEVLALAHSVGSTSQLIRAACELDFDTFIVATDKGIFHKMSQAAPHKTFIEAPTAGAGATCRSCAHCPWMAQNSLVNLCSSLEQGSNEISLAPDLIERARLPLQRMLDFSGR